MSSRTLGAARDLGRIGNDQELPAELLDVRDPPAQTDEMAAHAVVIDTAAFVRSLELRELKPQAVEFEAERIAIHALPTSKSSARSAAACRVAAWRAQIERRMMERLRSCAEPSVHFWTVLTISLALA
jgi:hypothetical protein